MKPEKYRTLSKPSNGQHNGASPSPNRRVAPGFDGGGGPGTPGSSTGLYKPANSEWSLDEADFVSVDGGEGSVEAASGGRSRGVVSWTVGSAGVS